MPWFIRFLVVFSIVFPTGNGNMFASVTPRKIRKSCSMVQVDPSGRGNFTTIQAAIDSVPPNNRRWICIAIKAGVYKEQLVIPYNKPFVYLQGSGKRRTTVVWDAHDSIATSATINSQADNVVAKSISFINSYNYPFAASRNERMPAVAALIQGDKSAFYRCRFVGMQDTLWDCQGRHYFERCTIQGAVDFIFGSGKSFYQSCTIAVAAGLQKGGVGFITAQGRSTPNEDSGFVFKDCTITGYGKAYLGRPWRPYARVVFYNTLMSNVVVPQGWDSWSSIGNEHLLAFDEIECRGLGADKTKRVKWANRHSSSDLRQLTSISYIDAANWLVS